MKALLTDLLVIAAILVGFFLLCEMLLLPCLAAFVWWDAPSDLSPPRGRGAALEILESAWPLWVLCGICLLAITPSLYRRWRAARAKSKAAKPGSSTQRA